MWAKPGPLNARSPQRQVPSTIVAVLAHEPIQSRKPSGKFCAALVVGGREQSKLLQKLADESLFQPTILHFKKVALDIRVWLTPSSFATIISVPQAFADLFARIF
jgi:hypothetical protein